jgi:hypothetical protein
MDIALLVVTQCGLRGRPIYQRFGGTCYSIFRVEVGNNFSSEMLVSTYKITLPYNPEC